MKPDAHNLKARRVRLVLAGIGLLVCAVLCYTILAGIHSYSEWDTMFATSKDQKIKAVIHAITDGARTITWWVSAGSFFLGMGVLALYELLKRKKAPKPEVVDPEDKVDHRNFFYCGLAIALVTALFGTVCCYVGYYTVNSSLDYRALELGKLVLGYAGIQLILWTWALYHCKKQVAT